MSTSLATMIRLRAIQNKTRQLFEGMSDIHYRLQYHHDLSPAGWHLGHGMFIENYWLHEVICGDNQYTKDTSLYIPEKCPKPERGPRLPPLKQLLQEIQQQQDDNDILLMEKTPPLSNHALFKNEYIENFIIQHYAQHYETIYMVLTQIAIKADKGNHIPTKTLTSSNINRDMTHIKQGEYLVGGEEFLSYDNELPKHQLTLDDFYISNAPVTNAEYLGFIEDNGYSRKELWCEEGWKWREQNNIQQPEHWKQNSQQQWYAIKHQGACDLVSDQPIYGISHYEAQAFSNWANARLPHEHEWETATRLGQLKNNSNVWEWCSNTFYPYDNFKAFPYDEYSKPWFDSKHFVLKGASPHTRNEIKRASFRNFFQPHQRHTFAGLRLVFG